MRRIIADSMLVKLARWLRLGGIGVYDAPNGGDEEVIRFVKGKKGVLLTRDEGLALRAKKQGFDVLLVKGEGIEEQLGYVSRMLGLRIKKSPGNICTICNGELRKISKKAAKGKAPARTWKRYRIFYICSKCGRLYWKGTHWRRIEEGLRNAGKISIAMK